MPAKKRSQANTKPKPPTRDSETADALAQENTSAVRPTPDEAADLSTGAESVEQPTVRSTTGVRRTQRTISRHVVDETIAETVVEDLPAAYSPPESGYPATVG